MQRIRASEVESEAQGDREVDRRDLADRLGTSDLAMNYYVLEPGEEFGGGMHSHLDQEEVFFVIEGIATFETKQEPSDAGERVDIGAGEAIRFEPGEFQQGCNETDSRTVALALGAPKKSTEGRIPKSCPECGDSEVLGVHVDENGMRIRCPECESEFDTSLME